MSHTYIGVVLMGFRRCVPEVEMFSILEACHFLPIGGPHSGIRTAHRILQCGYYLQTIQQDALSLTRHVIDANETVAFRESKSSF